jgi:hypothetical protein
MNTVFQHDPLRTPIAKAVLLLACTLGLSGMAHAQGAQGGQGVQISPEAAARIEKLSKAPFRWISMQSDAPRPTGSDGAPRRAATPAPAPAAPVRRPTEQARAPAPSANDKPVTPTQAAPREKVTAQEEAARKTVEVVDASLSEGNVLFRIADFSTAEMTPNGLIKMEQGTSISEKIITFSENSPSPVAANHFFDTAKKMVRVDYKVPASVGGFGGAGIRTFTPGDGIDLSSAVVGSEVKAFLILDLDVSVATTLKIILVGPKNNATGAFPYFKLPVVPGRKTYGLFLDDFITPAWAKNAPDIDTAMTNVMGIGVEYSRSDALGQGDQGSFWVGNIRISEAVTKSAVR